MHPPTASNHSMFIGEHVMADSNPTGKVCTVCLEEKHLDGFHKQKMGRYGRSAMCKPCASAYQKAFKEKMRLKDPVAFADRVSKNNKLYAQRHPEKRKADYAAWREKNKDYVTAKKREWYFANAASVAEKGRATYWADPERFRARQKEYARLNKDAVRRVQRRKTDRKRVDPVYALRERTRVLILMKLRRMGYTKRSRTHEILGCDWVFFKEHIERQFLPRMTWKNRDRWHIDHIIPISSATSEADVIRLNHFTNLRPMWAKDNLSKKDKVLTLF